MLLAEKDIVAGVRFPLNALKVAGKSGAQVESVIYVGATHCFDEELAWNPSFKFDPAEAARAHAFYGQWISGKG
jgi:dienelactone hydrolase